MAVLGWLLAILAVAALLAVLAGAGFMGLMTWLHTDRADWFSPLEEVKLQEWTAACEGPLAVGRHLEEVEAFLSERGVPPSGDREKRERVRMYYSLYKGDRFDHLQVIDKNVRNRGMGETDIAVDLHLTNDVVTSCGASIFRHGR